MNSVVRIRLCLADRAGALGQVATVIGLHGGNILSVDVHSTDGASAVDDFVVEFQTEPSHDDLGTDLSMTAAATIVQMEPAQSVDVVTAVLDALERGARTRTDTGNVSVQAGEAGLELIDSLAAVCPATEWSVVEQTPDDPDNDPGFAESDVGPQLVVPIPGSADALMGRRPATMDFTVTEKARVDAVIRLWECMNVTGVE
ncbi:MAG TPA: ACT domain-containing protein [Acidimicrobiales bacterium]